MRTRERLYILKNIESNQICAISEYEELIVNYINLFKEYFEDKYEIEKISNLTRINKYLIEYQDYHLFQRGNKNKLTLTEWEWNYYKDIFISLYERMKDTIINLELFYTIYGYDKEKKRMSEESDKLSGDFYDLSGNFYEFIGNIPIEYLKNHILREPIVAHQRNSKLLEVRLEFLEKISK